MIKNWKKFNEELSDEDILKNIDAASKLMNVDREIEKDMRENHRKHPQLSGLKALWNLPEDTLNEILWAFHEQSESEMTIGYACKYIDFMTAIADTNNPAEAWDLFCEEEDIDKENPFTESTNESLSNLQKEYREFFKNMLKCYDVTSPSKLSEEKKKEFFDNIKKYWVKGKGTTKSLEDITKEICNKKS